MDTSRANNRRSFDLWVEPFRLLRVEPTATKARIDGAFDHAQKNRTASFAALVDARDALLNPVRRLSCELAYPLDCPPTEIETFYAALGGRTSADEILAFSDHLCPLAQANFIAHIASHQPTSGKLLYALIESHVAIDATDICEKLKTARSAAEMPAPAFLNIHQGLRDLFEAHAAAAFVGYALVQEAAGPMLECTLKALATDNRYLIEALGNLLRSYARAIDAPRIDAADQIASACAALQQQPIDTVAMDKLGEAVKIWTSLCRPLLLWNADQPDNEIKFETPIEKLRALIANLCENKNYQIAIEVTAATREIFAAVPTTIDQLGEDARIAAALFFFANIKQLQDRIDEALGNPDPLIAALEKDGFGQTSSEPAQSLWNAFVRATARTTSGLPDLPWKMAHELTLRLSNRPEAAKAVAALIAGLLRHGQTGSAKPAMLRELKNNLYFMQSFIGGAPTDSSPPPSPPMEAPRSPGPALIARLRVRATDTLHALELRRRRHLVGVALVACLLLSGFAVYDNPDRLRSLLLELSSLAGSQRYVSSVGVQTMPPVGSGQHLEKDGVRYCYFQKERLRFIKKMTTGPEDARSYNLLIVDYNSRCSDFFYKDEDVKQVLAEVSTNEGLLQAEARQIVSTWPGHKEEEEEEASKN
jgi:hypothetical protein